MDASLFPALAPVFKRVVPFVAAFAIGGAGIGYAVHERNDARNLARQNQSLAAQNAQVTGQLNATNSQLDALTLKVNELALAPYAKPAPASPAKPHAAGARAVAHSPNIRDQRFQKLQSQLDEQGKAIDQTRTDLSTTRTELTGSIARTHDELVVLQKKGERNYYEFDIQKSKQFKHEGPLSISLRKANTKRGYADLQLIVDDRTLTQKHVNLYQPAMFYQPEAQQPVEIVINEISKDRIHGYVSAPRYRPSELAANSTPDGNMAHAPSSSANSTPDADMVNIPSQRADSSQKPSPRHKLPPPAPEPSQQ